MQNLRSAIATLLLSASCFLAAAYGQITPSGDTFTNSAASTTNYGSNGQLEIDGATSEKMNSYIQFDLSSIPSGAPVTQATLKLYVASVSGSGSFDVDYVSTPWSENTLVEETPPTIGGTIATSGELTTASKNQYILIDITPAVTAWLSGTEANNGIVLIPVGNFFAAFDSKENATTSHSPELDVVFGGDGTITGVGTAAGSGLAGGGTGGVVNLSLTKSCSTNQILQWNGTSWTCVAPSGTGTITGVSTVTGSGLAGGGTSGSLNLSLTPCAANQVLQFNGAAWACATGGTGTISGVIAGAGLSGGGTAGEVSLSLNPATVPLLTAANTFTGTQTVNGNVSATGVVTGSSYQIGSLLFGFGSSSGANAFLGFAGNAASTGTSDTGAGYAALHANTTGSGNTATGAYTLAANTTGGSNNAIGANALFSNVTGAFNNAVGNSALYNNTGSANNAVGYKALYANTTGIDNDASGAYALYGNTTGLGNEASGEGALFANTTGNHSTAVGFNALYTSVTGSNNTGLGYGAGTDSTTTGLNNATALGAWADVAESNAVVLGSIQGVNGCLSTNPIPCLSANVGIGTTTPQYPLDVTGNVNITGNLSVSGSVSKGSGSFKIDDPLDPANKYLYHSFVESPDMMDVYNGNITTNKRGFAVVVLPDYFEALNGDFRYQLTVIGQFAQAIVLKKISNNRFTIRTNRPGVEVSWQVTGIRHDAYANAHRIPTEENKSADEQGHYLHPELFGAAAEMAVGYARATNPQESSNSGQSSTVTSSSLPKKK